MSLTRNDCKVAGLTEEQTSFVIEKHTETISGIRAELKAAKENADKYEAVKKELDELKTANSGKEDFKAKYDAEHAAFEKFKSEITAKEARTAKEAAVKAYFEGKKIVGKNQAIAMRGIKADIDGLELDENGKIKDTSSLDELVKGDYAGLISTTKTEGANTSMPPNNTGGDTFGTMTLTEKMRYANEHPNDASVKAFLGS